MEVPDLQDRIKAHEVLSALSREPNNFRHTHVLCSSHEAKNVQATAHDRIRISKLISSLVGPVWLGKPLPKTVLGGFSKGVLSGAPQTMQGPINFESRLSGRRQSSRLDSLKSWHALIADLLAAA